MSTTVDALEKQILALKEQLAIARRNEAGEAVQEYRFKCRDGSEQTLAGLFGDRSELLVIHNMGRHCAYCTLWADGFNGLVAHLENRAAFVVISPDAPDVQHEFAQSRGWKFRMCSAAGTSFFKDMGFEPEPKKYWPGASAFRQDPSGRIMRTARTTFGPGDDFCSVWHLFELFSGGPGEWRPKLGYP